MRDPRPRRRCLKCGRSIPAPRWLCGACRQANQEISGLAEGVSDLYSDINHG